LVYGQEAVMSMELILPSLIVAMITNISDSSTVEERFSQLVQLEEDRFVIGFHQQVQKAMEKAWHDRHIKQKKFQVGDLLLLYDNKIMQYSRKFCMHWLGPYVIHHVIEAGAVGNLEWRIPGRNGEWESNETL
jgi:hypothetical protein